MVLEIAILVLKFLNTIADMQRMELEALTPADRAVKAKLCLEQLQQMHDFWHTLIPKDVTP